MTLEIAAQLIKEFEGCKLEAYICPAGVWTVGYGTTKNVKQGMRITQKEAESLLEQDLQYLLFSIKRLLKHDLSDNAMAALISFTYNVGLGALKKSTLLKLINEGKLEEAVLEFEKWNKGGGKVLPGLVKRRKEEARLFKLP